MLSITDIPQTTFWDNLTKLKGDLQMLEQGNKLLASINGLKENIRSPNNAVTRELVMEQIEELIYNVLAALTNNDLPKFTLNKRGCNTNTRYTEGFGMEMLNNVSFHEISLDHKSSLQKYAVTISCLAQCYTLLQTQQFSTKRDIFYSNTNFFKSQNVVDEAISNISCLLNVPRYSLNVLSSSKGFIGGSLLFKDKDGNQFSCGEKGIQIPNHVEIICSIVSNAKYILVIEKEATYTRLIECKFDSKVGPCIMITGKGFPDINTRMLLKKLQEELQIPVFALVDADPHGIDIMCVYKFGSKSLSHEAANLTCPAIKWIGILPKDIDFIGISDNMLIPMTKSDVKRGNDLRKRPYIKNNEEIKNQIELLLQKRHKAEIECLDSVSRTFMTDIYLPQKIRNGDWI